MAQLLAVLQDFERKESDLKPLADTS